VSTSAEIPHPAPVHVLMEESDPVQRAYAHLQLGERALERADKVNASRHYQQALELAPEDALVVETTGSARLRGVLPARSWWTSWWN
jgi:Tfp pilus assembly protein PilF